MLFVDNNLFGKCSSLHSSDKKITESNYKDVGLKSSAEYRVEDLFVRHQELQ